MVLRSFIIVLILLSGGALAEGRPWGVITPFGNSSVTSNGFQGRYNPWENHIENPVGGEPAPQAQKRLRQDWQNIYRPRSTEGEEIWPDSKKAASNGGNGARNPQARMFGNQSLDDGEQWPVRERSRAPYRQMEWGQRPFGAFAPNMMPQPLGLPYGGYTPFRPRY